MSVTEQHESLTSVEKLITEYSNNENMQIPDMQPKTESVATSYSCHRDMTSSNLFYNSTDINNTYQTIDLNTTEYNPMYLENLSKDVMSVNSFAIPSTIVDTSSVIPSTMSFIESNIPSAIEYSNASLSSRGMEHVPSNPIQNFTVPIEMLSPVHMDSGVPSEDLHMVSTLLNVPLEQLSNEIVPGQRGLPADSTDFSSNSHEMSVVSNETSVDFSHERLVTLDNDDLAIASEYQRTLDITGCHNDSSGCLLIDEDSSLSENYETTGRTPVPNNVDTSNGAMIEDGTLSLASITSEITIDASQPNNAIEKLSIVEDEPLNSNEEQNESPSRTETQNVRYEVTNQVNGTIYDIENEVPIIQMCIRTGCANPAVDNPEWEQEFCGNDCVVRYCRNIFDSWVEANAVMSQ